MVFERRLPMLTGTEGGKRDLALDLAHAHVLVHGKNVGINPGLVPEIARGIENHILGILEFLSL